MVKLLLKNPRISAEQSNFGWIKVNLTHGATQRTVNIRPSLFKSALAESDSSQYKQLSETLYSNVIRNTVKGAQFTARRQVEGIVKQAKHNDMPELQREAENVLTHSDEYVHKWYHEVWLDRMSDTDIENFYIGSDGSLEDVLKAGGFEVYD